MGVKGAEENVMFVSCFVVAFIVKRHANPKHVTPSGRMDGYSDGPLGRQIGSPLRQIGSWLRHSREMHMECQILLFSVWLHAEKYCE